FFLLPDRIEHADETALITGEHGDQPAKRTGERADEARNKFLLRRKLRELLDLRCVDDLTVNVRSFDGHALVRIAKGFQGFVWGDGMLPGKDNSGGPGEKLLELTGEISRRDPEERILDDRVRRSVFTELAAKPRDFVDAQSGVVGEEQILRAGKPL